MNNKLKTAVMLLATAGVAEEVKATRRGYAHPDNADAARPIGESPQIDALLEGSGEEEEVPDSRQAVSARIVITPFGIMMVGLHRPDTPPQARVVEVSRADPPRPVPPPEDGPEDAPELSTAESQALGGLQAFLNPGSGSGEEDVVDGEFPSVIHGAPSVIGAGLPRPPSQPPVEQNPQPPEEHLDFGDGWTVEVESPVIKK
ncbi:MAG: hypothetical protein LBJ69_03515 [Holosporales bacterium]|jgi:hypothetical protein|nr:hypothetical protein [Holosporales bacterium]